MNFTPWVPEDRSVTLPTGTRDELKTATSGSIQETGQDAGTLAGRVARVNVGHERKRATFTSDDEFSAPTRSTRSALCERAITALVPAAATAVTTWSGRAEPSW